MKRLAAHHAIVPFAFRLQVRHQTQEYPPNSSRLSREYSRAPRGAVMSLCTSIPATCSCSTFTPCHLPSGNHRPDTDTRAARQSPGQKQETDIRSRRGSGGYPARGSGTNLTSGHERSIGARPRRTARTTSMHLPARRHRHDARKTTPAGSLPAARRRREGPSFHPPRQSPEGAHGNLTCADDIADLSAANSGHRARFRKTCSCPC